MGAAEASPSPGLEQEPHVEKKRRGGSAKFKKGQKVLVPHTDQYYAAVVLQGQKRPDGQYYHLHYEGWSNKYNEWVEEAGLVRYDRALLEQSAAAAGNEPGDLTGRKRKADIAPAEPALAVEIPQQLRLHIPPLLKKVVLDDSDQINLKGMLLPLPRKDHGRPTVNDILKEYEDTVAKEVPEGEQQDPQEAEAIREMVAGVRQYFDQGLRHFLLYSHELQQADEVLSSVHAGSSTNEQHEALAPSNLYGAEHLCRMLVKLPELVPVAYMTPPDVVRLENALHDLMSRMTEIKMQARLFSLAEEYQKNAHFNSLAALHLQSLLEPRMTAGVPAGADTPAAGDGGGGTPAPETGANSEAEHD